MTGSSGFNKLLERQLKRYLKTTDTHNPELQSLFQAVSDAYTHFEDDRILIERALDLSGQELTEAYKVIAQKNKDLIDSLEYARIVQDSMLARDNLIREIFPSFFVLNKPKDIVSGDFFWLHQTEKYTYLAAVDCTGHGVPGAFMSVISFRYLNQAVRDHNLSETSDILAHLNEEIREMFRHRTEEMSTRNALDISLVRIDRANKEIQFSGACHRIYLHNGTALQEYRGDNCHIGQNLDTSKNPIREIRIDYRSGYQLYMLSDGYIDQFGGPSVKRFGSDRFLKLLDSVNHLEMEEQGMRFESAFNDWKSGFEQVDDALLLGVKLP